MKVCTLHEHQVSALALTIEEYPLKKYNQCNKTFNAHTIDVYKFISLQAGIKSVIQVHDGVTNDSSHFGNVMCPTEQDLTIHGSMAMPTTSRVSSSYTHEQATDSHKSTTQLLNIK